MEWNNELTLEFLEAYEKHPVLWNSLHPGHKNKNTLQDVRTEVANELSVTIPVVALKKKKESLMSTYRSLRKKIVYSDFRDYCIGVTFFALRNITTYSSRLYSLSKKAIIGNMTIFHYNVLQTPDHHQMRLLVFFLFLSETDLANFSIFLASS